MKFAKCYDHIIIGSGPAGSTIAYRLTDDRDCDVLMLEAGGKDSNPFIHIPAGFTKLSIPDLTWGFKTVPQRHLDGRELLFPQARIKGGAASINAMIYTRGARQDFDEWGADGCPGWTYEEVLPYFRRAENNMRLADRYHGTTGPLRVSDAMTIHPITYTMMRAAQEAGLPFNADFNGARQEGTGFYQTNTYKGRRAGAAACYLKPALQRPNLTFSTEAMVLGIEIENGRAVGVRIADGTGRSTVVRAESVIVTAGAIGSPRLLMLSGIGPADQLRDVGIPVKLDLPGVGSNLQDHLNVSLVGKCSGPYSYYGTSQWGKYMWWGLQYLLYRTGPLTTNASESGAFIRTKHAGEAADAQLHFMTGPVTDPHVARMSMYGITLGTNVCRPESRGNVRLRTSDPRDLPLVDPNYLAEPIDMQRAVEAFKFAREMMAQPSLRAVLECEYSPGPEVRTEAEIQAFVRRSGKTDYHPVGTCRIGTDEMAVVDPTLKVRGIEGLRVCDSSTMPTVISGNTNAATVMIAERAAEFISETRRAL